MKRIIKKEIERCDECYLCKVEDGFSSHAFLCEYYNHLSCEVSSPDTNFEAEKQMSEWFKNCKVWAEVK